MTTLICSAYFLILTILAFYFLNKQNGIVKVPLKKDLRMRCSGSELLIIFMYATCLMGLLPFLAARLAVLELVCLLGIYNNRNNIILSTPLKLFCIFLLWIILGILYTPNPLYGVRMLLKYIYPFLFAILTAAIVRDKEIFLKSAFAARITGAISILTTSLPVIGMLVPGVFWTVAALGTSYITLCMFSIGMVFTSQKKFSNSVWTAIFILPCIFWVLRTDIFGTGVALSVFFFLKYRLKAIPLILGVGCLGIASLFYIPQVKAKMYYRPDEVTITDFLTNNVDENNINTSGRKKGWEDVQRWYFDDSKLIGSGTGRVQTFFYTEAIGWQRGGQLHNDFLVMLCDNGLIGISLFGIAYMAVMFHCLWIYKKSKNKWIRLCAVTAGSSMIGILMTMYSDNTVSYSMATLGPAWGFYGMALGMHYKEKAEIYD